MTLTQGKNLFRGWHSQKKSLNHPKLDYNRQTNKPDCGHQHIGDGKNVFLRMATSHNVQLWGKKRPLCHVLSLCLCSFSKNKQLASKWKSLFWLCLSHFYSSTFGEIWLVTIVFTEAVGLKPRSIVPVFPLLQMSSWIFWPVLWNVFPWVRTGSRRLLSWHMCWLQLQRTRRCLWSNQRTLFGKNWLTCNKLETCWKSLPSCNILRILTYL